MLVHPSGLVKLWDRKRALAGALGIQNAGSSLVCVDLTVVLPVQAPPHLDCWEVFCGQNSIVHRWAYRDALLGHKRAPSWTRAAIWATAFPHGRGASPARALLISRGGFQHVRISLDSLSLNNNEHGWDLGLAA
jgi:hypothetical protein